MRQVFSMWIFLSVAKLSICLGASIDEAIVRFSFVPW